MAKHSNVRLIAVPYDSGHQNFRMGSGPEHLLDNGLTEALGSGSHDLTVSSARPESSPPVEVATAFELDALVSGMVRDALAGESEREFALVLSGNCNTAVGTIAGATSGTDARGLGVVWFDGHADFQTPETSTTGFSDNQGLSIAVGHCWQAMSAGVPGFVPVPEEHVVLVGASEIAPEEAVRLGGSGVRLVEADVLREDGLRPLAAALDELRSKVGRVYVHLDLDVLDPSRVGRANQFAPEGGVSAGELSVALSLVQERFTIAAAGIASYDPAFDAEGEILAAAISCAQQITLNPPP